MFKYNYKLSLLLFIILSTLLIIEGFFHYYSYRLSYLCNDLSFSNQCSNILFDRNLTGFNPLIWNENRIVEILQTFLLVYSLFYIFKMIRKVKTIKLNKVFIYILYIYFISILYYFLEEISWGQHIFHWQSNDFFLKYNNQGETNIHNISNIFDQLPRTLLSIWCGLSFIAYKYFSNLKLNEYFYKFIIPSKNLKYISYILLLFILPDMIIDKLNLHPGYLKHTYSINLSEIYDFISFNFIRLSEYQELIFTFYIFNHSVFYNKYLDHKT